MMALADSKPYICQYCSHGFTREKTLAVHVCEQKRRALAKTEKHVILGYDTFNKFYKMSQNHKGDKTYEEFARSPYYNAFVKFGSFVSNVNPLYPDKFINYVVTSGVKLDHWCRDELYDTYLFEMLKVEPVEAAVQRSLKHMMEWADANNAEFQHYFLYVNLNRAVNDIRNGYISPWLVLNCRSGRDMVGKFNDEQMDIIEPAFDVQHWLAKFKDHPADVSLVKEVCKETGID
jgi:hypothetical protein